MEFFGPAAALDGLRGGILVLVGALPSWCLLRFGPWPGCLPVYLPAALTLFTTAIHRPPQPAVSHTNVGELAMDVLIATARPDYLGPMEDANVLPCVGNDAFDGPSPGTISTALELFRLPGACALQRGRHNNRLCRVRRYDPCG